jgi:hypothetical protein
VDVVTLTSLTLPLQLHSLSVAKDYVAPETIAEAAVTNTAGGWCGGLQMKVNRWHTRS